MRVLSRKVMNLSGSAVVSAFSLGCDPGVLGSNPTSGSLNGACFSLSLCPSHSTLALSQMNIYIIFIKKKLLIFTVGNTERYIGEKSHHVEILLTFSMFYCSLFPLYIFSCENIPIQTESNSILKGLYNLTKWYLSLECKGGATNINKMKKKPLDFLN